MEFLTVIGRRRSGAWRRGYKSSSLQTPSAVPRLLFYFAPRARDIWPSHARGWRPTLIEASSRRGRPESGSLQWGRMPRQK